MHVCYKTYKIDKEKYSNIFKQLFTELKTHKVHVSIVRNKVPSAFSSHAFKGPGHNCYLQIRSKGSLQGLQGSCFFC